ncbi:DUF1236 domain-containing protein [Primorskyibacter flagellatus]|uniref:SH3 domain-containing protein n=1 Tax=Primorskyibacter flagellatus TaxID=1387277 RepID=A0A1W1YZ97_9RHOB|nr:DUF1236 domain-containing protein [Primorskyibacter flagellatus]SMC41535.1 SH3 domain-containing protein [Primorskyibacter flagellatus]
MKPMKLALATTALTGLATAPVAAALSATATTDLNLRAGPGPQFQIEEVIAAEDEVTVEGCLDSGDWCEVSYDGTTGWAYSAYLTTPVENEPVVIYENQDDMDVAIVEHEEGNKAVGAAAGGTWGAAAGSLLVGGPAAVAAGAVLGGLTGAASTLDETTVTYVQKNPVDPIYLNGEVAVGAGIPQEVELYSVPESDYDYINVNEQYVLVNPENRRIVTVVR